jgi:hypothetical protein
MEEAMAESMTEDCIEDRMDKAATRHLGLPPATRNAVSHFCTFAIHIPHPHPYPITRT